MKNKTRKHISVCTDAVFADRPTADAIRLLHCLGYSAFEFWGWWEKDLDAICAAIEETGIQTAACCTKFISLTDPACRADYLTGLRESIEVARRLGCTQLITQTGDDTGTARAEQHASLLAGLRAAVPLLEEAGITLLVEPLNPVDHPGYYLTASDEAFQLIDEVGSDWVKVLFDIYHQQISEGDLWSHIFGHLNRIGHFHAAGYPGRHEPDRSVIAYSYLFQALLQAGYGGYLGLEYFPVLEPEEYLKAL